MKSLSDVFPIENNKSLQGMAINKEGEGGVELHCKKHILPE